MNDKHCWCIGQPDVGCERSREQTSTPAHTYEVDWTQALSNMHARHNRWAACRDICFLRSLRLVCRDRSTMHCDSITAVVWPNPCLLIKHNEIPLLLWHASEHDDFMSNCSLAKHCIAFLGNARENLENWGSPPHGWLTIFLGSAGEVSRIGDHPPMDG